ncbi:WXG100 family type VII secretion target [Aeromicrobium stalagmiti]|uniref:WXG100 family type VII secretion target n=1 Tax=Aeromicrobium stalagmiti TaxID=2738988 RepID=UPI0015688BCC|nr:WXG100 family type VII secretion target [Aeromicrobium stalagmiti]NRQ48609.1 WXG100 family type VII secretion target [Aeromicrobium stalagmiti]
MTDLSREEQALTKAAGLVRDAYGQLNSQVADLPTRLETKGSWEGGGSESFTGLVGAWTRETGRILKALEVFEQNLTSADKAYTVTDQAQQDKYQQMANRMTTQG